jgi:hypothetical protein
MRMPTTQEQSARPEQCTGCGAVLAEDQRYCLQCGARHGKPRLDFTAFWKPLSPTDSAEDQPNARTGRAPSRGVATALATGVLAVGILAGAALGPGPASSPADSAALAQRALAALVARGGSGSQTTASTSAVTAPTPPPIKSEPTPTPARTDSTGGKAKSAPASSEASGTSESPGESTTSGPSNGSSEGSSKSSRGSGESEKTTPGTPIKLPAIKHVWVIALSGTSFSAALEDPAADPYLAKQLVPKGTLLSGYTLSSSSALGNGIALLSGQSVNLDTEQNCPTYSALEPPTVNATSGLAEGVGCVYPTAVKTLADELTAGSLTWKAYVQDMEAGAQTQPTPGVTCRRPELGATDPNQTPVPGDPYLTYRNPFVYFDSLLSESACASNDVDLSQLQASLATPANAPSLSWIVPSACNDGSATSCAPGAPAGLTAADGFLKEVVPQILATSAYSKEGLIVIVPDSPPSSPASAAGKPVGALLLSPFVHSGARVAESFNDFSLLKSVSLLFGVLPLGHANDPSTVSFGATVYGAGGKAASAASTAKKAAQAASTQPRHRPLPDLVDLGTPESHPGG